MKSPRLYKNRVVSEVWTFCSHLYAAGQIKARLVCHFPCWSIMVTAARGDLQPPSSRIKISMSLFFVDPATIYRYRGRIKALPERRVFVIVHLFTRVHCLLALHVLLDVLVQADSDSHTRSVSNFMSPQPLCRRMHLPLSLLYPARSNS